MIRLLAVFAIAVFAIAVFTLAHVNGQEAQKIGDFEVSIAEAQKVKGGKSLAVTFAVKNNHANKRQLLPEQYRQKFLAYDKFGNEYKNQSYSGLQAIDPQGSGTLKVIFPAPVPQAEEVTVLVGSQSAKDKSKAVLRFTLKKADIK